MFDRAWLVVMTILLAPAIPALTLAIYPALIGVAAIGTILLLLAAGALAGA